MQRRGGLLAEGTPPFGLRTWGSLETAESEGQIRVTAVIRSVITLKDSEIHVFWFNGGKLETFSAPET